MFTVDQSVEALDRSARLFSLLMADGMIPKHRRADCADAAIDLHLLSEQIAGLDKKKIESSAASATTNTGADS